MKHDRSNALYEQAKKYIPGGVNSPVRAFRAVGGTPFFVKRARGPYIYDEDGTKYLDYVCSWGPCILGHADGRVISAVREACGEGLTYGVPTEKETLLAQVISEAIPAVEKVRFVSSGTEAVMSAIRVARGYTSRDRIIKFAGHYHGHSDGLLVKAGSGLLTDSIPDSAGVPDGYAKNTLVAEFNSEKSVEEIFRNHKDIAAVIVEPVAANMGVVPPKEGFLKFLREITEKYGALLIFDEVITGFRLGYGGASEYFGVRPDLVTLGKIIGGGLPLAAYGGREDIMDSVAPLGSVYQAGTLSGNPIAVTAGLVTLSILRDNPEVYLGLERKARLLEDAFKGRGLTVNREGSLLSAFFNEGPVTDYRSALKCDTAAYANFFHAMLDNGIYFAPSQFEAMFLSAAHDDEAIEKTVEAINKFNFIQPCPEGMR